MKLQNLQNPLQPASDEGATSIFVSCVEGAELLELTSAQQYSKNPSLTRLDPVPINTTNGQGKPRKRCRQIHLDLLRKSQNDTGSFRKGACARMQGRNSVVRVDSQESEKGRYTSRSQ